LGLKKDILFLEYFFIFGGCSKAAMGGLGAQRPLGVTMRPKRLVRAAHGRAREAKTH
jgi:hypothetical protein